MSGDPLTDKQRAWLDALPAATYREWADNHPEDRKPTSAESAKDRLNKLADISIEKVDGEWRNTGDRPVTDADDDYPSHDDFNWVGEEDGETDDDSDGEPDDDEIEIPDLDERQHTAIRELPATIGQIDAAVDDLDGHATLDLVRDAGVEIKYDPASNKYYLADDRAKQLRSQTHLSLSAKTKHAKRALREEQAILGRLPDTTPLSIDDWEPTPGKETMVAAIGDVHFGDEVHDDRGRLVYDADIAHDAVDRFAEKVIRNKRQWSAEFEECVLCIMGDIATGTKIYDAQKTEIESLLSQQIKDGSQALTRLAVTLREHFDILRIAAIVGNHGFQDPSAARGSNTDLTCYYWLQDALRREGYDDVEIILGEHSHHLNIGVRDWRLHMRHGQDTQRHVDETARSQADWRGWRDKHKYDIGLRAHHHVPSFHYVLNRYPVVTIPSPKPGGEFADRIGDPDASTPADRAEERKLGYCFGVGDDRRVTDSRMTDAG